MRGEKSPAVSMAIYFLLLACVLCLLPLPALSLAPSSPPASPGKTTSRTTAATKASEKAVFRVQEETGIKTYDEITFLRAIVTCEMPLSYSEEALKAQTVASYTYYARQREKARERGDKADFSDVPSRFSQCTTEAGLRERLGKSYDTYRQKLDKVIESVYGYVIRYQGALILAAYHAISFGHTASGEAVWQADYPYLQSVPSPGDVTAEEYTVSRSLTADQVKTAFAEVEGVVFRGKPDTWFSDLKTGKNGLVTGLTVGGVSLSGSQVRKALELRSACFTLTCEEETFTFTTKGYGHGVGLSQQGAQSMAVQGSDWQEILHHYYTDVTIDKEKT